MTKRKTARVDDAMDRVRDVVADEILELTDDELDERLRAQGIDPKQRAGTVRAALSGVLDDVGKARRQAAKLKLLKKRAVSARFRDIPVSKLKALVESALQQPEAEAMSLAYREGKYESESDLRVLAENMAALGFIPDDDD